MSDRLYRDVAQHQNWRDALLAAIADYEKWLKENGEAAPRLADLARTIRDDRLVLAFLAEFSRGKTELINALFFGDLNQRLLPSEAGRTTMCPTEIFYDADAAAYLRLLPIETRGRDDSIDSLKREPQLWVECKLDLDSIKSVERTLRSLTERKTVSAETARALGLLDSDSTGDSADIPMWRHALVNYPHPLLQNGLVVLDTPGLNALGAEPELTLSMIPNAHAVLFVLGTDTGVTHSDLEVWRRVVQGNDTRRIAVLNKIDLLWDELKSADSIEQTISRQLEQTAALLGIPRGDVFAVSAQKALLAQVRDDATLYQKSGIEKLERFLANEIIPARRQILFDSASREICAMLRVSRESVKAGIAANREESGELAGLSGKNRGIVTALLNKLEADRANHLQTVETFKSTRQVVMKQGNALLASLEAEHLNELIEKNRALMEASWTTTGITRAMAALFDNFSKQLDKILNYAQQIGGLIEAIYARFQDRYGFARLAPPALNLEKYRYAMRELERKAEAFTRDPLNVVIEKRFLIRKFYHGLVHQARAIYAQAHAECAIWQKRVLQPIFAQLKEHERVLGRRVANVAAIRDNLDTLDARIRLLEQQHSALSEKNRTLERIAPAFEQPERVTAE
ncbi:MAG: dynamin family protein [Burkholderiales bacterium]|nr:dynamin family protein [Burkholderiales bacterium]MDQ3195249.1 dynamin family protein [Pseudomonadota bacterium]